jgi:hypothetical protein
MMTSHVMVCALACLVLCGSVSADDCAKKTTVRKLKEPTEIGGILYKRYAYFFDTGESKGGILAREDTVSGHVIPEGTIVYLDREGWMHMCMMSKDTELQGHLCRGHGHGWQTTFHKNGQLKTIWLAREEVVQGVPCVKAHFLREGFIGPSVISFHENGVLKSARLAKDITIQGHDFEKNDRVQFDSEGKLVLEE